MKILFFACTLLSALLLTLPPFLHQQIVPNMNRRQPLHDPSEQTVSFVITEPEVCAFAETAEVVQPLPEPIETETEAESETEAETEAVKTEAISIPQKTETAENRFVPKEEPRVKSVDLGQDSRVQLQITGLERTYTASLRSFLIGVVMAEMPSYFHEEALRAQAIAARSYLLYRQERGFYIYDYGSSSTAHFTEEEGQAFFGDAYNDVLGKVTAAVDDTDGQILYYNGRVCCAAYHAMSYARTEDAVHVWGGDTPYLASVETPECETLSGMTTEASFDEASLCRLLGVNDALPLVLSYTDAGRVSQAVTASGDCFDGEQLRSRLRLRSTAITVSQQNEDTVLLCVRGYGHGVGMSQYGADYYGDAGWDYAQILSHYYPGTTLGLLS